MLALSMTVSNRPHYLRKTLGTLVRLSGVQQHQLYMACEPGSEASLLCCRALDLPKKRIFINKKNYGINRNFLAIHDALFKDINISGALYVEEDVELGVDAVQLANWYIQSKWPAQSIALNLCNYHEDGVDDLSVLELQRSFSGIGLCFTRRQWFERIRPTVCAAPKAENRSGWDNRIRDLMLMKKGLHVLTPLYSRATHCGVNGENCTPEINQILFKNKRVNKKMPTESYCCRDKKNEDQRFLIMADIEAL